MSDPAEFCKYCVQNNSICPKYKDFPQRKELNVYNLVWFVLHNLVLHIVILTIYFRIYSLLDQFELNCDFVVH
jgi:hypothetical protein